MKNQPNEIVYVDMDEVLCKYLKAFNEDIIINPSIAYPQSQVDFFRKLEEVEGAIDGIKALDEAGYDVWILTRPSLDNPLCYTEKRLWVEDHLGGEWHKKLILAPDKSMLKGDYLIDDIHCEGTFGEFEGEQLLFKGESFPDWKSVLKYLIYEKNS